MDPCLRTKNGLVAAGLFTKTFLCLAGVLVPAFWCGHAAGAELPAGTHFRKIVKPILEKYCSDCHADGANKGGVAFDEFKSDEELLNKRDLWAAVLKNTRAGLMPPPKKPKPSAADLQQLE